MPEMTEERWKEISEIHRRSSWIKWPWVDELFTYAQSLRQENETLRLEFEGIDCEHRAKVMTDLLRKNENWQKAYIRITDILAEIPGGIDKLLDSIDAEPFDEETVQRMLGKIRGEIPIGQTPEPQQEQSDDSQTNH